MKFKQYDKVRVLNPCCKTHEYGVITDAPAINTPFGYGYEVDFIGDDRLSFIEHELEIDPRPIVVGSLVCFFKPFDYVRLDDGAKIYGDEIINDLVDKAFRVIQKDNEGRCVVLSHDFTEMLILPEDSLFVLPVGVDAFNGLDTSLDYYLLCPDFDLNTKLQLDFNATLVAMERDTVRCKIVHRLDSVTDYPAYMVEFENGVLASVYDGWLVSVKEIDEVDLKITSIMNDGIAKQLQVEAKKPIPVKEEAAVVPMYPVKPETKLINDNGVNYLDLGNGVRMFESGAVRSINTGKPRFDLISPEVLAWMAQELADRGGDYGTGNYLKGIPEQVCIESLERHLNSVKIGLKYGLKPMVKEAVNVLINAMFMCHTILLKESGNYKVSDKFKQLAYGQTGESPAA